MKFILWVLGLVVIACALYFVAPTEKTDALKISLKRLSGDEAQYCMDLWTDHLNFKDKNSIIIDEADEYDRELIVSYRAKNSFGSYVRGSVKCPVYGTKETKAATVYINARKIELGLE